MSVIIRFRQLIVKILAKKSMGDHTIFLLQLTHLRKSLFRSSFLSMQTFDVNPHAPDRFTPHVLAAQKIADQR